MTTTHPHPPTSWAPPSPAGRGEVLLPLVVLPGQLIDFLSLQFSDTFPNLLCKGLIRKYDPILIVKHDHTFNKRIKRRADVCRYRFGWIQVGKHSTHIPAKNQSVQAQRYKCAVNI